MIAMIDGAVGCRQADGSIEMGDSCRWTCDKQTLDGTRTVDIPKFFSNGWGGYVRHKDPKLTDNGFGAYYKNPWQGCISRDQLIGIIWYLIETGQKWELLKVFIHHAAYLWLFAYNTIHNGKKPKGYKWPDITTFNIWSMYLRGLIGIKATPILRKLDAYLLANTAWVNNEDNNDVISYLAHLFCSVEHTPTPESIAAWKLLDKMQIKMEVNSYWSGWRQNPGMAVLYIKRIIKLEKRYG